ncbi:yeats-domain-containing protein [Boletus reticuloceps]|uniref:Protein AF-9 homolog n=1 Tax=Boletus reticuloceps TaxID=495285 RepID=A0A8I3AE24_9AGAM|nr:yeats-domain-containing protein [Boletus reticuloceps]
MADRVRVRGVTIHRPIIYGNTAIVLTPAEKELAPEGHTHRWTVAVRGAASTPVSDDVGGADDLGYLIKRVTFKLHETYANPSRSTFPPFHSFDHVTPLTWMGKGKSLFPFMFDSDSDDHADVRRSHSWGEFEIQIRINFVAESGEKAITFYHHLKLHPWTITFPIPGTSFPVEPEIPSPENAAKLGPVHSWQYDELVFTDPFQSFLTLLTAHPPTPLPKGTKRPVPFHTSNPASLHETRKLGVPEFTSDMEKEEAERFEEARGKIVKEQEKWRVILIEQEKELERLQKLLG